MQAILEPMPWVRRWLTGLPSDGRVLDYAAGTGRHACLALEMGFRVSAWDRNAQALAGLPDAIETICTDLEQAAWPVSDAPYDAIIVSNYLFRPRLDLLATLLAPGGRLIYATFALGNERFGRPSNPDYLLAPGELLNAASRAGLDVIAYEHGQLDAPKTACVQRMCAQRPVPGEPCSVLLD